MSLDDDIAAQRGIRRRGDALQIRVTAGRDPVTGSTRWKTATVPGVSKRTLEQAVRIRRQLQRQVEEEAGKRQATAESLGALLDLWVRDTARDKSPSTVDQDRWAAEHYLKALRVVPVRRLTTEQVSRHYDALLASGGRGGRPLNPRTVRRVHQTLHAALEAGITAGWLAENPATRARKPKVVRKRREVATDAQVSALIAEFGRSDPEFGLWLRLDAIAGARRGEVLGLRWSDVHLDTGEVVFAANVVRGRSPDGQEAVFVRDVTKTERDRRIGMDRRTVELLDEHRSRSEERAAACGVPFDPRGFVFAAEPDGRDPWKPGRVTQRFVRARQRLVAGGMAVGHVRLGDLRHAVATKMIRAGNDITKVALRLGNSPRTIHASYLHELQAQDFEAAAGLAAGLDGHTKRFTSAPLTTAGSSVTVDDQ